MMTRGRNSVSRESVGIPQGGCRGIGRSDRDDAVAGAIGRCGYELREAIRLVIVE